MDTDATPSETPDSKRKPSTLNSGTGFAAVKRIEIDVHTPELNIEPGNV